MTVHGTTSYGTYVQLDDVKTYLGVTDTANDFIIQLLTDGLCSSVQRYCNRPIAPTEITRWFNGGSGFHGAYILLPYFPVVEMISVIEYQGSSPVALSEISPSSGGDGYRVQYTIGQVDRIVGGIYERPWYPGNLSVEISYVAGYNPLPADLRLATFEYIKYWWINSQAFGTTGANPYGDSPPGASGLWPGTPNRIKEMFTPFVNGAIG